MRRTKLRRVDKRVDTQYLAILIHKETGIPLKHCTNTIRAYTSILLLALYMQKVITIRGVGKLFTKRGNQPLPTVEQLEGTQQIHFICSTSFNYIKESSLSPQTF